MLIVQRCLLPILLLLPFDGDNPRSVIVLDNAAIHYVEAVTSLISASGALVRFLPPYPLDLNPIEEAFSKDQCTTTPRIIHSSRSMHSPRFPSNTVSTTCWLLLNSKYVGNVHVCMLLLYVVCCVCPSEHKKIIEVMHGRSVCAYMFVV